MCFREWTRSDGSTFAAARVDRVPYAIEIMKRHDLFDFVREKRVPNENRTTLKIYIKLLDRSIWSEENILKNGRQKIQLKKAEMRLEKKNGENIENKRNRCKSDNNRSKRGSQLLLVFAVWMQSDIKE